MAINFAKLVMKKSIIWSGQVLRKDVIAEMLAIGIMKESAMDILLVNATTTKPLLDVLSNMVKRPWL